MEATNKMQQILFIDLFKPQLYMFRATNSPILRSTFWLYIWFPDCSTFYFRLLSYLKCCNAFLTWVQKIKCIVSIPATLKFHRIFVCMYYVCMCVFYILMFFFNVNFFIMYANFVLLSAPLQIQLTFQRTSHLCTCIIKIWCIEYIISHCLCKYNRKHYSKAGHMVAFS